MDPQAQQQQQPPPQQPQGQQQPQQGFEQQQFSADTNPKQQLVERIKQATNVLVTVKANPSVDELAACIAFTLLLNKLEKHATAVFSGNIPDTIKFLQPEKTLEKNTDSLRDFIISLDKSKADKLRYKVEENVVKIFITPYRTSIGQNDLEFTQGDFNVDAVVALGVTQREELDQAIVSHGRILHDATVITICAGNLGSGLGAINWHDPAASSLSEMLVSVSEAFGGGLLDAQMSTAFLTGIVAETERFSNPKTSPKVMTMAAQLMASGANQQLIATELQQSLASPAPPAPEQSENEVPLQSIQNVPEGSEHKKDDGSLSISHDGSDDGNSEGGDEQPHEAEQQYQDQQSQPIPEDHSAPVEPPQPPEPPEPAEPAGTLPPIVPMPAQQEVTEQPLMSRVKSVMPDRRRRRMLKTTDGDLSGPDNGQMEGGEEDEDMRDESSPQIPLMSHITADHNDQNGDNGAGQQQPEQQQQQQQPQFVPAPDVPLPPMATPEQQGPLEPVGMMTPIDAPNPDDGPLDLPGLSGVSHDATDGLPPEPPPPPEEPLPQISVSADGGINLAELEKSVNSPHVQEAGAAAPVAAGLPDLDSLRQQIDGLAGGQPPPPQSLNALPLGTPSEAPLPEITSAGDPNAMQLVNPAASPNDGLSLPPLPGENSGLPPVPGLSGSVSENDVFNMPAPDAPAGEPVAPGAVMPLPTPQGNSEFIDASDATGAPEDSSLPPAPPVPPPIIG